MRYAKYVLALLLVSALGGAGVTYYQFQHTRTQRIDEHFHVVLGGGGNSSILLDEEGVLLVDSKFLRPGWRLASTIAELSGKPVKTIINTHYHRDHTHGNPNYAVGTRVIAQRRTRQHLLALDKSFWEVAPAWDLLPQQLIDDQLELSWGGETVRVIYLGRGHTDGDVVVHFVNRHLLQTGDLFVNGLYPRVDLQAGGSAREWLTTLDRMLAIDGVDQYIPGHGEIAKRGDVERFRSYMQSLVGQVGKQVAAGRSLRETQASVDLAKYDDLRSIPFFTSRDRNVASVYEELTGKTK